MRVDAVQVAVYEFPLEEPEADGTLQWDSTVMVVVGVSAGGGRGTAMACARLSSRAALACAGRYRRDLDLVRQARQRRELRGSAGCRIETLEQTPLTI